MSTPYVEAACTHLVTLLVDPEYIPGQETIPGLGENDHPYHVQVYTVDPDTADLVDVVELVGRVTPRSMATTAMLYNLARRQVRHLLDDMFNSQEPVAVSWHAVDPLTNNVSDRPGQRAAVARMVDTLTGGIQDLAGESLPRDRSIPSVGLVNLTYYNGSRMVR